MSSPNFEANEPLTRTPQGGNPQTPTGDKGASLTSKFFNKVSDFFGQRGKRQADERLEEKKEEVVEKSREKAIEQGTERAEQGKGPRQSEKDTIAAEVFNEQSIDAWQSQTRIEAYEEAEKQFEENQADPAGFKEGYESYMEGVEENLPTEAIPDFRQTAERQKRRFLRKAERNYKEIKMEENMASANEEYKKRIKSIRDMASNNPSDPNVLDDIKSEYADTLSFLAQYGPKGEFEVAGHKFSGGNGLLGADEIKERYDNLRRTTASEFVFTKFKKQNSLDQMRQYRNEFKKDMDRSQDEQKIETGTEMVLSDTERQKMLEKMDSYMDNVEERRKQRINGNLSDLRDRVSRYKSMAQDGNLTTNDYDDLGRVEQQVKMIAESGKDSAVPVLRDIKEIKSTAPIARKTMKFNTTEQFNQLEQKIIEKMDSSPGDKKEVEILKEQLQNDNLTKKQRKEIKQKINSEIVTQEDKFMLQAKLDMVQSKRQEFQEQIENSPYSRLEQLNRVVNKEDGSTDSSERSMDVGPLVIETKTTDNGVIKPTEEMVTSFQRRAKNYVRANQRYPEADTPFFEPDEKRMYSKALNEMSSTEKQRFAQPIMEALNSSDNKVKAAGYKALQQLQPDNSQFAHAVAVTKNNPDAGRKIMDGQDLEEDPETNPLGGITNFSSVFKQKFKAQIGNAFGTKRFDTLNGKRGDVKEAVKDMLRFDFFHDNTSEQLGPGIDAESLVPEGEEMRGYINKALGAKKVNGEWKGGVAEFNGQKVIVPNNMKQSTFEGWMKTLSEESPEEMSEEKYGQYELFQGGNVLEKLSFDGGQPLDRDGRPFKLEHFQREMDLGGGGLNLVTSERPGVYYVQLQTDGQTLKSSKGGTYKLDLRPLANKQPPAYFKDNSGPKFFQKDDVELIPEKEELNEVMTPGGEYSFF